MIEHMREEGSLIAANPAVVTAVFVQAWENVRHIRNERIWFTNAYTAVIAGGLALLQRDIGHSTNRALAAIGLGVLALFSLASLTSSIRLVMELRNSITNLRRVIDANGMSRMVGLIEPSGGFAARLPVRWVFPIFFGLTTASLVALLIVHLLK